jgi:predicted nucleotidyltransferase
MTTDLLSACQWPPLSPSYDLALREAVAFILEQFEVYGIIVSGSIIRGNPHPSSDFDLVVIHAQPERQRLQRLFRHVPTEIFLNPPKTIRRYFEDEQKEGKPSTAHMLATGFVILDRDPVVNELREQAQELIGAPPPPPPKNPDTKRDTGGGEKFKKGRNFWAPPKKGGNWVGGGG